MVSRAIIRDAPIAIFWANSDFRIFTEFDLPIPILADSDFNFFKPLYFIYFHRDLFSIFSLIEHFNI